jgi:hypothetical protein
VRPIECNVSALNYWYSRMATVITQRITYAINGELFLRFAAKPIQRTALQIRSTHKIPMKRGLTEPYRPPAFHATIDIINNCRFPVNAALPPKRLYAVGGPVGERDGHPGHYGRRYYSTTTDALPATTSTIFVASWPSVDPRWPASRGVPSPQHLG